jgi:hypothetical protein
MIPALSKVVDAVLKQTTIEQRGWKNFVIDSK